MSKYIKSDESRELVLYTENTLKIYENHVIPAVNNMKKRISKGEYLKEKGVVLWNHVTDYASIQYKRDFGYAFDPNARYTAAVDLENEYYEMIVGGEI